LRQCYRIGRPAKNGGGKAWAEQRRRKSAANLIRTAWGRSAASSIYGVCHRAMEHAFLVMKVPSPAAMAPFIDQEFEIAAAAKK
jgi:hypothetical protein